MTPAIFIMLLNPVTSAIFAAALFVLWKHQRHLRYVGLLALAFGLKSLAYLVQFATLTDYISLSRIVSNALFVATAILVVGGLISRYKERPPYVLMTLIGVAAMLVLAFYQIVDENYAARVIALNAAIAAISAIGIWKLLRLVRKAFIEMIVVCVMMLHFCGALLRPVLLMAGGDPTKLSIDSVYWLGVAATDIIMSLLLVLGVVTGVALDLFAKLRIESIQDSLSHLLNRRGFEESANASLRSDPDRTAPAALILADLDHFKAINDTYGHAVGDQVIVGFARSLAREAADGAVLGRIGGEEFAVLLPGADAAEGVRYAERVRLLFALTPLPGVRAPRNVTASFGIAGVGPGGNLEAVMRDADQALYEAKRAGRDTIRVASSTSQAASVQTAKVLPIFA
ncbi:GGDEF domain-containing protein [Enterovirga rhinocerotis]|uniref:diguanylate cyclase n=1 Tax=Enterovirga rhinocerotis TaxID=1339210 RepID=A0A4R7C4E2_9HYPH|nr:GGDEF domain-containing protein [Enterovirga rhinocerotis]TDR93400.1 diguanylate cyclase (GGDEF)-like protein [Enterovirga rhinocerotis]